MARILFSLTYRKTKTKFCSFLLYSHVQKEKRKEKKKGNDKNLTFSHFIDARFIYQS